MQNPNIITLEEMITESELFQSVYPVLIGEIDRIEKTRGKLNDFQLMQAVAYAKNGLGVLSFERRQTVKAMFDTFINIYRRNGRTSAVQWAVATFGCTVETVNNEEMEEILLRIQELSNLIQARETELLHIYRELYMLERYLSNNEGPISIIQQNE